jgi:20S proteasome alpha/beta subunit
MQSQVAEYFTESEPASLELETNGMTLVVVALCKEGLVLASDTRVVRLGEEDQTASNAWKIEYNNETGVASAFAGDTYANYAASHLDGVLARASPSEATRRLTDAAEEIVQGKGLPSRSNVKRPVVLFSTKQPDTIWRLDMETLPVSVQRLKDKTIIGALGNLAKLFTEHYYDPTYTLTSMTRLAAHTILVGGEQNPTLVSGLDIVTWTKGAGFRRYSEDELQRLRDWSKAFDDHIKKFIAKEG